MRSSLSLAEDEGREMKRGQRNEGKRGKKKGFFAGVARKKEKKTLLRSARDTSFYFL